MYAGMDADAAPNEVTTRLARLKAAFGEA
jgi:hypothetical protein